MRNTTWMSLAASWLLAITIIAPAGADEATPTAPAAAPASHAHSTPEAAATEALFRADAAPLQREAARKRAITLALAGDGHAAFQLGVLFRHGMDHPARAVERDLDTARHWLEKCVDAPQCPAMALASLAELELEAERHREAMQWAQAWAAVERELHRLGRRPGQSAFRPASYTAHLLKRCFDSLPARGRDEAVAQAFEEFQQRRGVQLHRMAAAAVAAVPVQERDRVEFAASQYNHPVQAAPRTPVPAVALYLLRADPAGGRPEAVTLIESLPAPRNALAFTGIARRWESKPYAPSASGARRYGLLPVELSDPRYVVEFEP